MHAAFIFIVSTAFIYLFHLFIFKRNKPPNIRWTELSLIFNTALPVQHLSHGTPLYLRLPLTQSGLGICHLPPCIVRWNDRIPAGTCRSHPACFPWICAQHPNGNMSLLLPLSTSCTWPPSGKKNKKRRLGFVRQQWQEEITAGSGPDGKVWPAPRWREEEIT